jgi:Flp pilus assembly protein TadD
VVAPASIVQSVSARRGAPPVRSEADWSRPAAVVLVVIAAYLSALPNAFVWDDENLIVANPLIKAWSLLPQLFGSPLQPNTLYYRPLQGVVYVLEYQTFGLWAPGFHVVSVLVHAAVGVLLYRLVLRLFGDADAAIAAALLFVVHPVHSEAVTYLSGLSDPLSALCLLAALLWSVTPRRRVPSLLAFLLALLARESAVALVPLVVLVDVAVAVRNGESIRGTWGQRIGTRYLPYLALVVVYLAARYAALGAETATYNVVTAPLGTRLVTMSIVVVRYLGLLVFPAALHMERSVPPASLFDPAALGSIAVLGVVSALATRFRQKAWPLAFGWAWFLLGLLPVANLMPLSTFMAEHWLYVPSMGIGIAAGWGIVRLAARRGRPAAIVVLAVLVVAYGARTAWRNRDWRDGTTIYLATLRFVPGSARLHTNLGRTYWMQGQPDAALREFASAIALAPDDWQTADAYSHRGIIYVQQNRAEAAIPEFRRAIELAPRNPSAYINLSLALQAAGRIEDGRRALADALRLDPNNAIAHANMGNLFFNAGDLENARRHYLQAIALNPELPDAHSNLGSVYLRQGQLDLAERSFRTALALEPNHDLARRNLQAVLDARAAGRR